ncbi:MAG: hypothetical protein R6V33_05085 [Pelovirga sp.]
MVQFIKNLFSKGGCEKCGWLVACPDCSEKMRIADKQLKIMERSHARRKESRYVQVDRSTGGPYAGMVDKGSFVEVLQQVLSEHRDKKNDSLMLMVKMTNETALATAETSKQLQQALAQRLVALVRHEDFITSLDDQTFALLLIDSGEEPLEPQSVLGRIEEQLQQPFQTAEHQTPIETAVRQIRLTPGTTLENIVSQMDS